MLGKGGLEEALHLRLRLYHLDVRKNVLYSTFNIRQTTGDICPASSISSSSSSSSSSTSSFRSRGCKLRRVLCVCVFR